MKIRWCPSHQGIEGNEVAGEWAKLAADEPDAHGVEWFSTTNPDGTTSARKFPLPRSLANVKRGFSEQKRSDTRSWATRQLARTRNRKYRPSTRLKPDTSVAKTNKRLASRFYQVKTGHCLTGRHLLVVPVQDPDAGTPFQELPPLEESAEDSLGGSPRRNPKASRPHPGQGPDQYRGAARRPAVQSGGTHVYCDYRRRTDVRPTGGRRG